MLINLKFQISFSKSNFLLCCYCCCWSSTLIPVGQSLWFLCSLFIATVIQNKFLYTWIYFCIHFVSHLSDYYSLTMITYHISILYSLGCALPVLSEVVRVIIFAYRKTMYLSFSHFPCYVFLIVSSYNRSDGRICSIILVLYML